VEPAAQPESSRAKVALGCSIVSTHHRKMVSDGDNAAHPAKIDCDARKTFESTLAREDLTAPGRLRGAPRSPCET
jgi:hypothetical protein